jgi:hypothetical protein
LHRLKIGRGVPVDIAASDGVTFSSTLSLYRDGWSGLAVEADRDAFAKLCHAYKPFDRVNVASVLVTLKNVVELLRVYNISAIDFLNIDIDSYDLDVTLALLDGGCRPSVISIEINEKIPPPIYFSLRYADGKQERGVPSNFHGCSATAAAHEIKPRGYVLDRIAHNNAFFVRSDLNAKDLDVAEAYRIGYADRPDRLALFPWNEPFEEW